MASRILRIIHTDGKPKNLPSSGATLDFLSIKVGPSALEIKETTGHFDFSAKRLTNLAEPTVGTDAATRNYADSVAAGFDPKASVQAATTAALATVIPAGSGVGKTLTAVANGALVIDGYTFNNDERILVKNQVLGADNGIYVVTDKGSAGTPFILTRAADFDGSPSAEVSNGAFLLVVFGTLQAGQNWFLITNGTITVDTTALVFSQSTAASQVDDAITDGVTTRAPSQNAVFDALALKASITYVDGKVVDAINDGVTTSAPSQNAVFDALALKASVTYVDGKVVDAINDGVTTSAPSQNAVFDALALKSNAFATLTNDGTSTVVGEINYLKSNGNIDKARANATGTCESELYATFDASIANGASGKLTKGRGEPVAVTGASFTIGGMVFLSAAVAAEVTQTMPSTVGQFVVPLGKALSATTFEWNPGEAAEIIAG